MRLLAALLTLALLAAGCASAPPAPAPAPESAQPVGPPPPAPAWLTPEMAQDEEALAATVRRYSWHDHVWENYPVLKGLALVGQVTSLWLLAVLGGMGT